MEKSCRILAVDDDEDTLDLIQFTLSIAGHEVRIARNAAEALSVLAELQFDLILLDVMMPEVSGFDLLEQLQREGRDVCPVVFLTATGQAEDREVGDRLGAAGYLVKPVTRGQLLAVIERVTGGAQVTSKPLPDDEAG